MTTAARETAQKGQFEVFYDGDCPLCMREIRMLMRRDKKDKIRFTNIATQDFDPSEVGVDKQTLMGSIHGRLETGELVTGVEVFRNLYEAVGFGALVKLSRAPGISNFLDFGYRIFAKNRLRLTGRCTDDSCAVPTRNGAT